MTLHDTRDFADVIALRIWVWEVILDFQGGRNMVLKIIIRGRHKDQREGKGSGIARPKEGEAAVGTG